MNPFCEIAVEEAIRLKEAKIATEVVAVTIGDKKSSDVLRTALAMGCDRGIHVVTDMRTDQELQPLAVSKVLAKVVEEEEPQVVVVGKQAIDDDSNQTAQMLAGLLKWPQVRAWGILSPCFFVSLSWRASIQCARALLSSLFLWIYFAAISPSFVFPS